MLPTSPEAVVRLLLFVAPIAFIAQLCQVEEFGLGSGSITVHNADSAALEIVVSDTASCFAGMRTELGPNTTRVFSIDENGAYFCVGEGGGVAVANGGSYEIRGGALGPRNR